MSLSYCQFVASLPPTHLHRHYHDTEYGVPCDSDNLLFGKLLLEINQAGLSWDTILKKAPHFKKAYQQYDIKKVAAFTDRDIATLLSNSGIVRNRRKIEAAISNATTILQIQSEYGSFKCWLSTHQKFSLEEWITLFRKTFTFTGPEITKSFLKSIGSLPAHDPDCPRYTPKKTLSL